MKRWRRALAGVLGILVVGAGVGLYRLRDARTVKDVLPRFTEPGPGPRAPSARAFTFEVGVTSLGAARAWLAAAGLDCPDTSMRGLMAKMRAEKKREIAAVRARGGDVDSVSGASLVNRRSPKEANTQVRLSCENIAASLLTDRARNPSQGRLLLVFDSPSHPLRLVSFERSFPAAALDAALVDLNETRAAITQRFGPPVTGPRESRALPWLSPLENKWRFADLEARVSGINWGDRGAVVSEIVEVPWPVRADAPARAVASR